MRRNLLFNTATCLLLAVAVAVSQTAPAKAPISFEVASVKASPPPDPAKIMSGQQKLGIKVDAGRVDIAMTPLISLIATAYRVKPLQVTGPDWLKSTMFDIQATFPAGATKEQLPEMLQSLLAERFKLAVHNENKETSEYTLVVAKGGPKLKEAEPDGPAVPAEEPGAPAKPGELTINSAEGASKVTINKDGNGSTVHGPNGDYKTSVQNGVMRMEATKVNMTALSQMISQLVQRPVVDKTELKGNYQLVLEIPLEELMALARASGAMGAMGGAPPASNAAVPTASDPGSSIFSIVQQFGLKLVSQKVPSDFLVVDHMEKVPTEN